MAKFVAISGPSSTGKTSLIDCLSCHQELSKAEFSPDLYNTVWGGLVASKLFTEYGEIIHDSEYICVYLLKLIEYYKEYIEEYKDTDKLVILDCCWLDLYVYALINMWCAHTIKAVQVDILEQISQLIDSVDMIYLTYEDPNKVEKRPYRAPYKIYTVKANRSLELQHYKMAKYLVHTKELPSSDISESALFIIEDLKKLGYL